MRPAVASTPSLAPAGRMRAGERGFGVYVAAAAVVALVAAGATLGRETVWNDEFASLALVGRPFGAMVRQFPHEHNGILFDFALRPVLVDGW